MRTVLILLLLDTFVARLAAQPWQGLRVYVWSFQSKTLRNTDLLDILSDEFQTEVVKSGRFKVVQRASLARLLKQRDAEQSLLSDLNAVPTADRQTLRVKGAQAVFFGTVIHDTDSGHIRIAISLESLEDTSILLQESVLMRPPELYDAEFRRTRFREILNPSPQISPSVKGALSPESRVGPGQSGTSESEFVLNDIVGCWSYNNHNLRFYRDGRVVGFLNGGRWVRAGGDRYVITWPPSTDTLVLSSNGKLLTGSNNYAGPGVSWHRVSAESDGLVGTWQWMNGTRTIITKDGNALSGTIPGKWKLVGENRHLIVWEYFFIDHITISKDGQSVSGQNQLGLPVRGSRTPCLD